MDSAMKRGAAKGALVFVMIPSAAIVIGAIGAIIILAIPLAVCGAVVGAVLGPIFSLFSGRKKEREFPFD
jgi:hypothetical protein